MKSATISHILTNMATAIDVIFGTLRQFFKYPLSKMIGLVLEVLEKDRSAAPKVCLNL